MSKPRVFIASSTEALAVAQAIQHNLDHVAHSEIWTHGSFLVGEYPLDALIRKAAEIDYAVLVFNTDDMLRMRGRVRSVPRDNVIFELGLFIGRLGKSRTCIVKPRGTDIAVPSDIAGLVAADYDPTHPNPYASLGPACVKITSALKDLFRDSLMVRSSGVFESFQPEFESLFANSKSLTLFFIHSRRWREMNDRNLQNFLSKDGASLTVVLPDPSNKQLMQVLGKRFEDGDFLPSFVADAYRYFSGLMKDFKGKVRIFDFDHYPTYSCYRFDTGTVIAMYPTYPKRQPVPTFEGITSGQLGVFVDRDLKLLLRGKKPKTRLQLDQILATYHTTKRA